MSVGDSCNSRSVSKSLSSAFLKTVSIEPAGKPVKVAQISPEMLTQPLRLIRHICWKVFMRTPGSHLNAGSASSALLKNTSSSF